MILTEIKSILLDSIQITMIQISYLHNLNTIHTTPNIRICLHQMVCMVVHHLSLKDIHLHHLLMEILEDYLLLYIIIQEIKSKINKMIRYKIQIWIFSIMKVTLIIFQTLKMMNWTFLYHGEMQMIHWLLGIKLDKNNKLNKIHKYPHSKIIVRKQETSNNHQVLTIRLTQHYLLHHTQLPKLSQRLTQTHLTL